MSSVIEKVEYFDVIHNELNSDWLIPAGFRHEMAFFVPTRISAWRRNFVNMWEKPVYLGRFFWFTGTCLLVFNIYTLCVFFRLPLQYKWHLRSSSCARSSSRTSWPLKMGPIGCPETSVWNYHSTLLNIPEECRSHLCTTSLVAVQNNLYIVIEIPVTRKEVPLNKNT